MALANKSPVILKNLMIKKQIRKKYKSRESENEINLSKLIQLKILYNYSKKQTIVFEPLNSIMLASFGNIENQS